MYRPKQGRGRRESVRAPRRRNPLAAVRLPLTVVFWASALIFVALMALYAWTKSVGMASSWAAGISLALMTLSSGAITWIELGNNPLDDTERGEWSNQMLFYGLMCVFSFLVACLYLPALYFAA
jgi:hypothetical protein